jgi:hypothetical protein
MPALMGGGGSVDAAFASIASHAGHGHILILRAVSDDGFDADDGNCGKSFANQWGPVISAETTDSIEHGSPTQVSFASPILMRSVVPPDES